MYYTTLFILFVISFVITIAGGASVPECQSTLNGESYFSQPGLCAWTLVSNLNSPRTIRVMSNGDILVLESGKSSVTVLFDANLNGIIDSGESAILATQSGLNHGLTVHGNYLYATTPTTLYRWSYTVGNRTNLGAGEIVLNNIPANSPNPQDGHRTRTIEFANTTSDVFYLSVGSSSNLDDTSIRSRVVKCAVDLSNVPSGGYNYNQCTIFADGCRNEVGLRVDSKGRLWGVENGFDNAFRSDMGGDIHNDNPCEEVNLFETEGGFYGYPYCFSEGILPAQYSRGSGYQWATNATRYGKDDSWCNNTANVIKPAFCMAAHTAPLDIMFNDLSTFPYPFNKGILVSQHGSWNRNPPAGYQVISIETDETSGLPINSYTKLFGVPTNGISWNIRPVSLAVLRPCGNETECLLVSDNGKYGGIYAIRAGKGNDTGTTTTTTTTTTSTISPTTTGEPSSSHPSVIMTPSLIFISMLAVVSLVITFM